MFAGQPWPVADAPVTLEKVAGLDLYRRENPFRVPWPYEFRTLDDLQEFGIMCTAGFPEPYAFSRRVYKRCATAATSSTSCTTTSASAPGCSASCATAGRSSTRCTTRSPSTATSSSRAATSVARKLTLRRWYGFLGMQMQRRAPAAAPPHGVGELEEGHRRADGCRPRHAAHRAGRRRPDSSSGRCRTSRAFPGRLMTTASADVPLKGLTYLIEALAKIRTERRRRAPRRDRPAAAQERGARADRAARPAATRSSS